MQTKTDQPIVQTDSTQHQSIYDFVLGESMASLVLKRLDRFDDMDILEIGCGGGEQLIEAILPYQEAHAVGVDISRDIIIKAKRTAEKIGKQIEYVVDDATRYKLHKQFDRAFMINLLHFVGKPEQAVQNLLSHLKPGGKAIIVIRSKRNLSRIQEFIDWFGKKYNKHYYNSTSCFTLETNADLFHRLSHVDVSVEPAQQTLRFTDPQPILKYMDHLRMRWKDAPTDEEWTAFHKHITDSINDEINSVGYFDDYGVFGLVTINKKTFSGL